MVELTSGARSCLNEYLAEVRSCLRFCRSVRVDEVENDVREHIEHALSGASVDVDVDELKEVLGRLGSERAWVVHGAGLDELTTVGKTTVAALENGKVETFEVTPEDFGLKQARIEDLSGGEPHHNASLMRDLFDGRGGPLRDIVLLNSGAALMISGRAASVESGIQLAAQSLDSGLARGVLEELVARTNVSIQPEAVAE